MTTRTIPFWRKKQSVLIVLPVLFALSVAVRAPQFNQPLSMGHQWLSAHVLITLEIWAKEGIHKYNYNPIYTYNNSSDRHLQSLTSGISDSDGNFYYVSYPPLAFLLPFITFSLIGVAPSILALQIFSLAIHAITAWLLYALIVSIYGIRLRNGLFPPALIAYSIYLFMPLALWYHMNVYFADMLVQPLWIASIWFAFQLVERNQINRASYLWGYGIINFLSVYTEWLGVFAAFVFFVLTALRMRSDKRYLRLLAIIALSTALALALIIVQYSAIAGLDAFLQTSIDRYAMRSGVDERVGTPIGRPLYYAMIFLSYWYRYYPILALLAFLFLFCAASYKRRPLTRRSKHLFMVTSLVAPIVLHHVIFFDFTYIHEFSGLKTGVLFCYLAAALYHHGRFAILPDLRRFYNTTVAGVTAVMLGLCIYTYRQQSLMNDPHLHEETAAIIRQTSAIDETIYLTGMNRTNRLAAFRPDEKAVSAQLIYYAGRNMLLARDSLEIFDHMKQFGVEKAVIYTISEHNTILGLRRITKAGLQ